MSIRDRFAEYVRACFPGIWIESHEHQDALAELSAMCREEDWQFAAWDVASGLQTTGNTRQLAGLTGRSWLVVMYSSLQSP